VKTLLLKSGRLIDPASSRNGSFDVLVRDGRVAAIEHDIEAPEGTETVDVRRLWIVPGLIDVHVHLRDPGFPAKETISTGLRAAAAGGFTTVAAMANTSPVNDRPEIASYMIERAREVHGTTLVPVSAVSMGLGGVEAVDFEAMTEMGVRLFSDDGIPVDDPELLRRALEQSKARGLAISLHEEDRGLSCNGAVNAGDVSRHLGVTGYSGVAESDRIRRDLPIALQAKAPVHIAHVSTAESLDLIRSARSKGGEATCEVTPHHFALDDSVALTWGPNAKMNPPLRSRRDVEAIRASIADGTIDMIASDHAPHDPQSKHMDEFAGLFGPDIAPPHLTVDDAATFAHAANGIVGLETSLGLALDLVHRRVINAPRMITMMSAAPARLLRLNRGRLAVGDPADITVIDPDVEWTVEPDKFLSKSRNTPFRGTRLKGRALLTIVAGEIVFDGRKSLA
jgi:dihydroorotase